MMRMYVAGISWYVPQGPNLILTSDDQQHLAAIPCAPDDFTKILQVAQARGTKRLEATTSVLIHMLIELSVCIEAVQLLSMEPGADEAIVHFTTEAGRQQQLICGSMEAIAMALLFDSPVFVNEQMIVGNPNIPPIDSNRSDFSDFVQGLYASDFNLYVKKNNTQSSESERLGP